jgi:hypothetical protein
MHRQCSGQHVRRLGVGKRSGGRALTAWQRVGIAMRRSRRMCSAPRRQGYATHSNGFERQRTERMASASVCDARAQDSEDRLCVAAEMRRLALAKKRNERRRLRTAEQGSGGERHCVSWRGSGGDSREPCCATARRDATGRRYATRDNEGTGAFGCSSPSLVRRIQTDLEVRHGRIDATYRPG